MIFSEVLSILKVELIDIYSETFEESPDNSASKKEEHLRKIESVILKVVKEISRNQIPYFETILHTDCSNCYFDGR